MSPRWEPNPNIPRGRTVVYTLHAHLVSTPKYRRGPFTDEILTRCEEIMRAVCADFETELVEFNGERDHVHLLVHYPPKVAISRLVGSLKGVSARRLRQEFPGHIRKYLWGDHFWSPVLLRRVLRRRTAGDHQGVHREPEASRLRPPVRTRAPVRVTAILRSASSRT
ncbi:REP element-mobilizing transposase RayT [Streptomyces sp. TLI_185]|nr:REP element-mobilizing transposase RayT [Streptomyces sp. TLI_185]